MLFNTPIHVYHSPPITLVSYFGLINKYLKFKRFLIPPESSKTCTKTPLNV